MQLLKGLGVRIAVEASMWDQYDSHLGLPLPNFIICLNGQGLYN